MGCICEVCMGLYLEVAVYRQGKICEEFAIFGWKGS